MEKETPEPVARRPRVDAQRNRERILDSAREAFTQHGAEATMDDIARRAEVGPGTLYRHFPTREDLIEAVYRSEVDKLTTAAERCAETLEPVPALRAWLMVFIDYVAAKLLIMPAMDTVPGGSKRMMEGSQGQIHTTFRTMVQRAVGSGALDPRTNPDDLIRAFIGVLQTTSWPGWEASARRIVDILIEGAQARGPA